MTRRGWEREAREGLLEEEGMAAVMRTVRWSCLVGDGSDVGRDGPGGEVEYGSGAERVPVLGLIRASDLRFSTEFHDFY